LEGREKGRKTTNKQSRFIRAKRGVKSVWKNRARLFVYALCKKKTQITVATMGRALTKQTHSTEKAKKKKKKKHNCPISIPTNFEQTKQIQNSGEKPIEKSQSV
jgi:hypothetical protein